MRKSRQINEVLAQRVAERTTFLGLSDRGAAAKAGLKPHAVADIMRGRHPGAEKLKKLANALETTPDYFLGYTDDPSREQGEVRGVGGEAVRRALPVLDANESAGWAEHADSHFAGHGPSVVPDVPVSVRAFALRLADDSMAPEFAAGDVVIIDPAEAPRPGDCVAVRWADERLLRLRRYHRRRDSAGAPYAELAPINPAWETRAISWQDEGEIVGVMLEHRRARR